MNALPASAGGPEDDADAIMNIVLAPLAGRTLSDDAYSFLYSRVSDAFRVAATSVTDRFIEFRTNAHHLGETLADISSDLPADVKIDIEKVKAAFLRLCPGFWPFC